MKNACSRGCIVLSSDFQQSQKLVWIAAVRIRLVTVIMQ